MAKFKKGDVCIVLWSENFPELVGEEVVLTSDYSEAYDPDLDQIYYSYGTDIYRTSPEGLDYYFGPTEPQLKLKQFKGEQSVMEMFKGIKLNNVVDKQLENM